MNNLEKVSAIEEMKSGLNPIQEKAAILLASGRNISEVAEELNINRGTLYIWLEKVTFQCFYNAQIRDIQANIRNGIFSLCNESINTLRSCLSSPNESVRMKAATFIIDKIQQTTIGETSPEAALKKQCTHSLAEGLWDNFDMKEYHKLLKENGLI